MNVNKIRISIGSASVLGLNSINFKNPPTTCYLMTYREGSCLANCGFCAQSRNAKSSNSLLSRITWPTYSFDEFLMNLKSLSPLKKLRRICLQTLNYPNNFEDVLYITSRIKEVSSIPISVAIPPISNENLRQLKGVGVQRIGIALDGATPKIFEEIKGEGVNGPYKWESHFKCLKSAINVFSEGHVSTHLIVGLGETHKEILKLIEQLYHLNIIVSLFAFLPVKHTKLENKKRPNIIDFRVIQLGCHLIITNQSNVSDFVFNENEEIINFHINRKQLYKIINEGEAFLTSGCKDCNRPYYTSRPSGPSFNFSRKLTEKDKKKIFNQLSIFINT